MRPEDTLAKTVELLQRIVPDGEPPAVNWAAVAIQPRDSQ
jgi:hypothetical protein